MKDDEIEFTYLKSTADGINSQKFYEPYRQMEENLKNLTVTRGADKGGGFAFEIMDAADHSENLLRMGIENKAEWINNNGPGDVIIKHSNGKVEFIQNKLGYRGTSKYQINVEKYPTDTTFRIDKGNEELYNYLQKRIDKLSEKGIKHNMSVEYSEVTKHEVEIYQKLAKNEVKLMDKLSLANNKKAPITSKLYTASKKLNVAHKTGVSAAKGAAALTAGISMGKHFYELIEGNEDIQQAVTAVLKDTAISAGSAYGISTTLSIATELVANTPVAIAISAKLGGTAFVSIGNVVASMSVAMGPAFIMGLAIGSGITACKLIKRYNELDKDAKRYISIINDLTEEAQVCMELARNGLKETIEEYFKEWDKDCNKGFDMIFTSIYNDDVEGIANGLDLVLRPINGKVAFKSVDNYKRQLTKTLEL